MVREDTHAPEDCHTHITLGGLGGYFKRVHDFEKEWCIAGEHRRETGGKRKGVGLDENSLYACMKFSNNKEKNFRVHTLISIIHYWNFD